MTPHSGHATCERALQICLFDPGLEQHNGELSNNLGDLVIQEAVIRELKGLFPNSTINQLATHQYLGRAELSLARSCQLKVVGGSSLLSSHHRGPDRQWLVKLRQWPWIRDVILLGPGWHGYQPRPDLYTRIFLRMVLSTRALHAVRSNYAKQQLQAAGIRNVITTLCPSLWQLAGTGPSDFPAVKSDTALVTLTDFRADAEADARWMTLVRRNYREVFFWPQGKFDHEVHPCVRGSGIRWIERNPRAIRDFVQNHPGFDYVGTRLHGGILCLQSRRRVLILIVDNRTGEMAATGNLPACPREDVAGIESWITSPTQTALNIDKSAINLWRTSLIRTLPSHP